MQQLRKSAGLQLGDSIEAHYEVAAGARTAEIVAAVASVRPSLLPRSRVPRSSALLALFSSADRSLMTLWARARAIDRAID